MEIRKSGYLILAVCGLGALGFFGAPQVLAVPDEKHSQYEFMGSLLLLLGFGLLLWILHHKRRAAHDDWLFQNGIPGTATIVDEDLGGSSDDLVWVKLSLEVEVPPYEPRLVPQRRVYMPYYVSMWMLPGMTLQVYANPKDPEDFILVF